MQPINPISAKITSSPSLDAFTQGASQSEQLRAVVVDGQAYTIQAVGQMNTAAGPRSVAWVQGDVDTTALFLQAFGASFGGRLSAEVSRELGLQPSPGKPLASRLVTQALDMAQTGQQAFSGIDFLTRLAHSATAGGAAFKEVVAELELPAAVLSDTSRRDIDARMVMRFDAAAASGQTPVSALQAGQWLRAELVASADGQVASLTPADTNHRPPQRV